MVLRFRLDPVRAREAGCVRSVGLAGVSRFTAVGRSVTLGLAGGRTLSHAVAIWHTGAAGGKSKHHPTHRC